MAIKSHLFFDIFLLFSTLFYAQENPSYTIYLIGDTGAPQLDGSDPVFDNLKKRLDTETAKSAIIFLGDNIYENGLPPLSTNENKRKQAEKKILVQLDALGNYKGKIFFIPGNHDWNNARVDGINYVLAQEEFIELYLDRGDVFIPDHGCPGPETKKLGDNAVLVVMDSQWWLHPHPDDDLHHSECGNKNKVEIIQELKEILDKNDEKIILLAFHHPIYSDGSHSGYFPLKDHIFPLTSIVKGFYLPLPVIGSIYPFFRSAFGLRQDLSHPLYKEFKSEIMDALHGYSNILIASGHEHNLQYFYRDEQHFIKSGSGSKTSPLPKLNEAAFNSSLKGYAKVEIFANGVARLKYYTIKGGEETEAFNREIIKGPLQIPEIHTPYDLQTEMASASASSTYNTGKFHQFLFGKLYREDWAIESSFRTMNLSKERGGLRPLKAGGGMTSNSLRLEDKNKKQFVLRSVQKSVTKVVPPELRNSLIQRIFQDQIAASQPFAALAVPPMAKALGIYHTNPEIVYLPKQPGLGDFGTFYGEELYLFEERPAGDREDDDSFGNSQKIISYSKMVEKILKTPKHHIHQEQVLKSRMFDIYLGDWDRHDDQWRWASFEETHTHDGEEEIVTFYEPIPRDRDQVFFKYKGLIPWISKLLSPQLRKFKTFGPKIKNVKYLGYNARHFDRSFTNEMDKEDWISVASEMQEKLTDEVINRSVERLPEEIQSLRGEFYIQSLLSRRKDLTEYATKYYEYLSKYVDVVGTQKDELFEIERMADNTTKVIVSTLNKNGEKVDIRYERIFYENETKEVRLYGLEGEDQFVLTGEQRKGPLIRIIGGENKDVIRDQSNIKGLKKGVIVYDSMEDNDFRLGKDVKDLRSNDFRDNLYDRKEFYYDTPVGLTFFGYNPDDGFRLTYNQSIRTYGFRKSPFKTSHTINATVAFGSGDLGFDYQLDLLDVVGQIDFNFEIDLSIPNDVENYFGLSNEIEFDVTQSEDLSFYQYEQSRIFIKPSLGWMSEDLIQRLQIGPYYLFTNLHNDQAKFVSDPDLSGLGSRDFEYFHFTGLDLRYSINKTDHAIFPTSGMKLHFNPSINIDLNDQDRTHTSIYGSITSYNFLWVPRPFIWASKIEGGINLGDFNFFQAKYAGRTSGLRAFRQNRFGGKSSFIWSNDLKVKVIDSQNETLPFSFGLIGSFDYGRVWNANIISDRWHSSYGGGIWLNFFDILPLSFYYMTSREGESSFIFKSGFSI